MPNGATAVRLKRLAARETFQARTGRDPFTDPELLTLRDAIACGLDLERKAVLGKGKRTRVLEDPSAPGGLLCEDVDGDAGQQPLHPALVSALRALVALPTCSGGKPVDGESIGATDAGVALLLWNLDASNAFPVALPTGRARDVKVLIERLKKRLSYIAA